MKLPRSVLDAYNKAIKQCGDSAEVATRKALNAWLDGHPGASIAQIREVAIAIMDEFGTVFGQAAGDASYAMRSIAAEAAGVEVEPDSYAYMPDEEYVRKTAKYQIGKLIDGDRKAFVDAITDGSRYFAERGANDTMAHFASVDKGDVRFARVPTGATTCPYCLMLASRGFVYRSEASALNANHRHCDCRIIEGFAGMEVEGYDPDKYYDMWKHPEKYQNVQQPDQQAPQQAVYAPKGTKSEAVKYAHDELGFEKLSSGFTLDELNAVNGAFTKYFDKFPFMKGVVKEIKTGKMHACAYYSSGETRTKTGQKTFVPVFKFDRASIRSVESDCKYCCDPVNFRSGYRWWSQKAGIDGIVMHEGVHAIEYKVLMHRSGFSENDVISPIDAFKFRQRRGEVSTEVVTEAFRRRGIAYTDENVKIHVSEYGSKNSLETLAEALSCEDESNDVCNEIKVVFNELLVKEGFL